MEIIKPSFFIDDEEAKITIQIVCDIENVEVIQRRLTTYCLCDEFKSYCKYADNTVIQPYFCNGWKALGDAFAASAPIIITHNLREWRYFFGLRCPKMKEISRPLFEEFRRRITPVGILEE